MDGQRKRRTDPPPQCESGAVRASHGTSRRVGALRGVPSAHAIRALSPRGSASICPRGRRRRGPRLLAPVPRRLDDSGSLARRRGHVGGRFGRRAPRARRAHQDRLRRSELPAPRRRARQGGPERTFALSKGSERYPRAGPGDRAPPRERPGRLRSRARDGHRKRRQGRSRGGCAGPYPRICRR